MSQNQQFNRQPTFNEPLQIKGATSRSWYSFFAGIFTGQPTGPLSVVLVGSSPFKYVAAQGGTLIVSGGSTTQIEYSRDGVNFYGTGQTAGMFPMSQGDTLRVTYPVAPPLIEFSPR